MFTYQDFTAYGRDISGAINALVSDHMGSEEVRMAKIADQYDRQRNTTIMQFTKWLYASDGHAVVDRTASNNKLCSSFFNRLNTQRNTYSLGNGIYFDDEGLKESLGDDFDTQMRTAGYYALIHGTSFIFWNVDRIHIFPMTEFAPLWDEETGALRGGIRYWQISHEKPMTAIFYEEDGFTRYRASKNGGDFEVVEPKRGYKVKLAKAPADAVPEVVGEENYGSLPIIPLYGSRLKQSTLVGMRGQIDAYDLIRSGYANDLQDCSQIYWIVSNAGGMDNRDLATFRDRLRNAHIANVENADETTITPYSQDIPYNSREAFLANIRSGIYEDFGGLDVHTIAAGATNDHIDAAYQPMDENADDYEYQLISAISQLLALQGKTGIALFKRNRISNQAEYTGMILSAAEYLDSETILNKLPFLTPDEVEDILERKEDEEMEEYGDEGADDSLPDDDDDGVDAMFDDLESELEAM